MTEMSGPMSDVWRAVMERGSRDDVSKEVERDGQDSYDMRLVGAWIALSTTDEELWHLQTMLRKSTTFQEIRVLLKLYVIAWTSLSDILAVLVNEAFEVGYAEQDVELSVILRNRHVRRTEIAQIIAKHRKVIQHEHYAKLRNDIIHRGSFKDPEFDKLHTDWLMKTTLAVYMIDPSDEAAKQRAASRIAAEMDLTRRIREFVEARSTKLAEHLAATKTLLDELGVVLAARIRSRHAAA